MSMRIAFTIAAVLGCGLAACGNKKSEPVETGKPIAIADASSDTGVDAAPLEAANELDVARYKDEVAVDHVRLKVKASAAIAFKSYPMGDVVMTLDHDDEVVQLSERYGFYRVTFSDSKDVSRKLMGWIGHFAFEEPPPAKKKLTLPRCSIGTGHPGTALLVLEDPPRCAYVCKDATECVANGSKCEARIVVPKPGEPPSIPSYTTVCAAVSKSPEASVGAGKSPPSLYGTPHSGNGKCPRLFVPAPKLGSLCYRSCKVDVDCPDGSTCKTFGKIKLCSVNWSR